MDKLLDEVKRLGKINLSEAKIDGEFADEFFDDFYETLFDVA